MWLLPFVGLCTYISAAATLWLRKCPYSKPFSAISPVFQGYSKVLH